MFEIQKTSQRYYPKVSRGLNPQNLPAKSWALMKSSEKQAESLKNRLNSQAGH